MLDFTVIRGKHRASVNAVSYQAQVWMRRSMVIDPNNPSCVIIQPDYVEDIVTALQEEGFYVEVH